MKTSTPPLTHSAYCIKAATAILGDKWTPLIIAALKSEPKRFCQVQKDVGGINPRTLSARLTELENNTIITKQHENNMPLYALSPKGQALLPIIASMKLWGETYSI